MPEGHLYYFSPDTLAQYFRKVGLIASRFTPLHYAKTSYNKSNRWITFMMKYRLINNSDEKPQTSREKFFYYLIGVAACNIKRAIMPYAIKGK